MPSTNGHGPKRAILYARVSTAEQARSGYSLAQQIEALRQHAGREGYEVLEEVLDPGQSGASLARPGMDRVRDLVAAGGVCVVLAQDRDRIAREPAYHYLLRKEFEERGTKIRALNDRGDESPEGELTDGILDQLAKFERAKMAERTRRGKLRKAREGKISATMKPPYGFRYNSARDGLEVYGPEITVVERVFRWAAEGSGTTVIQRRLHDGGVPTPTGRRLWSRAVLKRMVMNDLYRPHAPEEVKALVSADVAAGLDPSREYGIRWWNRSSQASSQVSEADAASPGGRRYRTRRTYTGRAREEWIGVPVPAYLSRPLVDQARAMMGAHRAPGKKNLTRGWELRGVLKCPCGARMSTHTTNNGVRAYYYYRCNRAGYVRGPCRQKMERAERMEATVWAFVSGLLGDPERIRAGMDALIEQELAVTRNPAEEARAWAEELEKCAGTRRAYQGQQAAGLMTLEELRERLEELESTRRTAEAELEAVAARRERVEGLEADRDTLLGQMSAMVPEALEDLAPEGRNEVYQMLRLEVTPTLEGYAARGVVCTSVPSRS